MAFLRSIPYGAFAQRPLSQPAPPSGDVIAAPVARRAPAIATQVFGVSYTSGLINTAFPNGERQATLAFLTPVAVISVTLTSSLINAATDAAMAAWVGRDTGVTACLTGSNDNYVVHVAAQTLSHSISTGIAYEEKIAPYFGSGEQMAIYISSSGTGFANNRAVVVATIKFFVLN